MLTALYYVGGRNADVSRFIARFPDVDFETACTPDELISKLGRAEVLFINSSDFTLQISQAINDSVVLQWIQFTSSGIDGALKFGPLPRRPSITNVAGLRAANLSEHAFAMLLFLTRELRLIEAARAERSWAREAMFGKLRSLSGRSMLIVGMGAIGRSAALKAKGFGMRVAAVSRAYEPDALVERVFARDNALEGFRAADVVLIAAPSEPAMLHYLDEAKLEVMKTAAIVLNVSRGDLVDEHALARACRSGKIAGAGLDVMEEEPLSSDSELWRLDNVVITPHVGGAGSDQLEQLLDMLADNLERYIAGRPLLRRIEAR